MKRIIFALESHICLLGWTLVYENRTKKSNIEKINTFQDSSQPNGLDVYKCWMFSLSEVIVS